MAAQAGHAASVVQETPNGPFQPADPHDRALKARRPLAAPLRDLSWSSCERELHLGLTGFVLSAARNMRFGVL